MRFGIGGLGSEGLDVQEGSELSEAAGGPPRALTLEAGIDAVIAEDKAFGRVGEDRQHVGGRGDTVSDQEPTPFDDLC